MLGIIIERLRQEVILDFIVCLTLINSACTESIVLWVSSPHWQCYTQKSTIIITIYDSFSLKEEEEEAHFETGEQTYTFMDVSSDAHESVGQSAGAALLLWLRWGIVAEHSLNIETQHKTQETACLTVLRGTWRKSDSSTFHNLSSESIFWW